MFRVIGMFAGLAGVVALGSAADSTPSGKAWVDKFPGSSKTADLEKDFRGKAEAFIKAAKDAGADVSISSTLRPKERAYLMHWSWMIGKKDHDAKTVPAMDGVAIERWHGSKEASKKAAEEMMEGYGIAGLGVAPALASRHTEGKAVDMQITWKGTLKVKNKDGVTVEIDTTPRNSTNAKLIEVGATYDVIHFKAVEKDKVHWSTDGK